MESLITTLYEAGGWALLIFGLLVIGFEYGTRAIIKQFQSMNRKIDELNTKVSDLRCDVSSYITAIRTCQEPNCPNKQLLNKQI